MEKQAEFLDAQLQSLQEMHSNAQNLPHGLVASIGQLGEAAADVNKRCLQLVGDLEEARQEEQVLVEAMHKLYEEHYAGHS